MELNQWKKKRPSDRRDHPPGVGGSSRRYEALNSAEAALRRLEEGNRRFADGTPVARQMGAAERAALANRQDPFAIILGCSDSRVPSEIVFDQGLGDLFVIRVAGNIAGPSQVGSVEFAVESFGVPLVVVLGHSGCGAISATIEQVRSPRQPSRNLTSILDKIRPAVEPLLHAVPGVDDERLIREAVRANVIASVDTLRYGSELLGKHSAEGDLVIVGAEYSLESGEVTFLQASS